MTSVTIEPLRAGDLTDIFRNFTRFWGDNEFPRALHHPMFIEEFGDTAFVARDQDGSVAGYLLGFVAPVGYGYIHFVGVRDDARHGGLGRRLYERFESVAAERGATGLKAITSIENEGSQAFHRRMGFTDLVTVENYGESGRTRVIMRKKL
jgi:ribosomal protein S18 acetylase RimI-like enzyme